MTEIVQKAVQCLKCRHYVFADEEYPCFPDGIPDEIWEGKHDHREPHEGDHGYMFEPIEGSEKEGEKP